MDATLAFVSVGCNAASNALSIPSNVPRSHQFCGAFAAKNVVSLLSSNGSGAPLTVVKTLKHLEPTADSSRLTCVRLQFAPKSSTVWIIAGDSDGRVFLWTWTQDKQDWELLQMCHTDSELPAVAVAAVAIAETSRRQLFFATFSDGTLAVFQEIRASGKVTLMTKLELGVKCIMEAVDAVALTYEAEGEKEENVLLAAGGVDSKVHLFEVAGGFDALTPLLELEGHRGWIRSLSFHKQQADSDVMLASASQDQRIRLWKITGRSKGSWKENSREVHDGFLAVGQQVKYTVSFDALLVGHEDWVTSVQWMRLPCDGDTKSGTQDSSQLALLSSSMDNTLIVWTKPKDNRGWSPSLRVGELGGNGLLFAGALPTHNNPLNLISLNFGGQLERWEQQSSPSKLFYPAISVNGHCAEVTDLSWSPRGDYLVSVSLDQTARVMAPSKLSTGNSSNWHEISRAQVHGYDINCACFVQGVHSTNDQFVSGADEKILRVFEAPDEVKLLVDEMKRSDNFVNDRSTGTLDSKTQGRNVQHAYLPELSLTNKSATETQVTTTSKFKGSDNGYAELVNGVCLPVGDTLGRKTLWPEQRKLYGHGNELLSVSSSHAGDLIASACKSREERYAAVRLWKTEDWSEAQLQLEGHKSSVVQLAFSPNDQYLLSVSRDRQFCLYERHKDSGGKFVLVERVKAHRRIIWSCSWSPDSSVFVLGSRDQSFSLWSQVAGKWSRSCEPMMLDAAITAVSFAPHELSKVPGTYTESSYLLAVGFETGAIRFFTVSHSPETSATVNCSLLSEVAWEDSPSAAILRLAWKPTVHKDGLVLAAASSDSSVRIYNVVLNGKTVPT